MNKANKTILVLGIIILVLGSYITYIQINKIKANLQYESYQYGQASVISLINEKGEVPILIKQDNQTSVQWISLQQLCGGSQ